jgi:hypothetical protein
MGLDRGPKRLGWVNRSMEEKDQLHDGRELGAVDLCGNEAGWHQLTVMELRVVVSCGLGEPTHQFGTHGEAERPNTIPAPKTMLGTVPLNQTRDPGVRRH